MRTKIIDEEMKMFKTTKITMQVPLIFRPGTESFVTDQFKWKLMKALKIGNKDGVIFKIFHY